MDAMWLHIASVAGTSWPICSKDGENNYLYRLSGLFSSLGISRFPFKTLYLKERGTMCLLLQALRLHHLSDLISSKRTHMVHLPLPLAKMSFIFLQKQNSNNTWPSSVFICGIILLQSSHLPLWIIHEERETSLVACMCLSHTSHWQQCWGVKRWEWNEERQTTSTKGGLKFNADPSDLITTRGQNHQHQQKFCRYTIMLFLLFRNFQRGHVPYGCQRSLIS